MGDYVCITSKYWHSKICDIEDAWSAAREEDVGIVVQELEGEDVFGVILPWYGLGAYPVHVMTSFVEGQNALTCSEGEEE